jgi:protein-L-isoaspartate(D-aspartate) O-methyltransferase
MEIPEDTVAQPGAIEKRAYAEARQRLIDEIEAEAKDTRTWTGRARFSDRVMAALARVPRHVFVPPEDISSAYVNRPLSIGHGQTISQPYIVAVMTDLLDLADTDRVLEIGTGCGYQTAVLAEVAGRVYSIEVIEALATAARRRLIELNYDNVEVRAGDGFQGWPEEAPFDAVMVTAAPRRIPSAVAGQLKIGGRMVVPVGRPHQTQTLVLGVKQADGTLKTKKTLPVAFVPMVKGNQ